MEDKKKLGIAIIGLGEYAETQILPALKQSANWALKAVVTDDDKNKNEVAGKYGVSTDFVYSYEEIALLKNNDDIQLVFISVPNKLHTKYCLQVASIGKHILCEKPMAANVDDCKLMIDVCRKNNIRLFIGYRLHFNPQHIAVINLVKNKIYGELIDVSSSNGFHLFQENDWRLNKEISGGGSMMDMGIYIVNAYRQLFDKNPKTVFAKKIQHRPHLFKEVEESMEWEMHYENGITAKGFCSYYHDISELKITCERARIEMFRAYKYDRISVTVNGEPLQLEDNNHKISMLDHIACCLHENKVSMIEPEEGMHDLEMIETIYKSMEKEALEVLEER